MIQQLVLQLLLASLSLILSACGTSKTYSPSLVSGSTNTTLCRTYVRSETDLVALGETVEIQLVPKGTGPFSLESKDADYIPDASGGLRIANDSMPLQRELEVKSNTAKTVTLQTSYSVRESGLANAEDRYVREHPGGVEEKVYLRDTNGERFLCSYKIFLRKEN